MYNKINSLLGSGQGAHLIYCCIYSVLFISQHNATHIAISTMAAGMSTRGVSRTLNVHFNRSHKWRRLIIISQSAQTLFTQPNNFSTNVSEFITDQYCNEHNSRKLERSWFLHGLPTDQTWHPLSMFWDALDSHVSNIQQLYKKLSA